MAIEHLDMQYVLLKNKNCNIWGLVLKGRVLSFTQQNKTYFEKAPYISYAIVIYQTSCEKYVFAFLKYRTHVN